MTTPPRQPRRHARISDLPDWPCPPRVEAIAHQPGSWGYLPVSEITQFPSISVLAHDEEGYLWVRAAATPTFRMPDEQKDNPGAIVFHTDNGIGLWIHPKSYRCLGSLSRTEMQSSRDGQDAWIPIAEVAAELPAFVTSS